MTRCRRFGKFSVVGLVGAALQLLVFDWLVEACHVPTPAAVAVAVEIVVLHNFLWHERFTWRERGATGLRHKAARLWRFHAANGLVSLAGNALLSWLLLDEVKAPPLLAGVTAIALCAPINFLLADRWVFSATIYLEER